MTATSDVSIERRGSALWVVLSRPQAFNAITPDTLQGLQAALAQSESDATVRAMVITGSGKAFCAGADLKAVHATGDADAATRRFLRDVGTTFGRLEALPIPTIAAVNGVALAGGLELMLCCDVAIAAAEARLGDGHANFGQIPGGGGTLRLPRRIGASRAKHLMFTGQTLSASEALAWGLVDEVADPGALSARVDAFTAAVAGRSALVLARMKALVNDGADRPAADSLEAELVASDAHMASHDRNEGLAAFTEKRAPRYLGR